MHARGLQARGLHAREEAPDFLSHPSQSANFSHAGPDSKYFWLWGPRVPVTMTQICHFGMKAAMTLRECGCEAIKL